MSKVNTTDETLDFFKVKGEQFGGGKTHVDLEIGQQAGPFVHVGIQSKVKLTEDSEPIDLFIAMNPEGEEVRMPASAVFRRNAQEANLKEGDSYLIYRAENATKKKGKGKGREMSVYYVKVISRKSGKRK